MYTTNQLESYCLILHGTLLTNHITVIANIGVSCIDDMNDDASERDSFFRECYRLSPSSPLPFVFERAWE